MNVTTVIFYTNHWWWSNWFHVLWDSRQLSFLNCLGPAIELEKVKPETIEPEPEVQKTFSEEANTSTYYPAPVPVMDKYILENGKVFYIKYSMNIL